MRIFSPRALLAYGLLSLASAPPTAARPVEPAVGGAAAPLGSRFHRLDQGRIRTSVLPSGTKAIAIYYGASWCGPCRAFVPELIAAYPRLRAAGIELLFVSDDATCPAALDYARTSRMPWLLLPCDRRRRHALRALGGEALPGIVVVSPAGIPLTTSWGPRGESQPRRILRQLLAGQISR